MSDCKFCLNEPFDDLRLVTELKSSFVYMGAYQNKFVCRAIVSLKTHRNELFELTPVEMYEFTQDCARVAEAMKKAFPCDKINYGIAGDVMPHVHMHLVGKKKDGPMWSNMFSTQVTGEEPVTSEEQDRMIEKLRSAL